MNSNAVYNVSEYLHEHPGGADVLLESAGADATDAFEGVGHSESARAALDSFYLGHISSEVRLGPRQILSVFELHLIYSECCGNDAEQSTGA